MLVTGQWSSIHWNICMIAWGDMSWRCGTKWLGFDLPFRLRTWMNHQRTWLIWRLLILLPRHKQFCATEPAAIISAFFVNSDSWFHHHYVVLTLLTYWYVYFNHFFSTNRVWFFFNRVFWLVKSTFLWRRWSSLVVSVSCFFNRCTQIWFRGFYKLCLSSLLVLLVWYWWVLLHFSWHLLWLLL